MPRDINFERVKPESQVDDYDAKVRQTLTTMAPHLANLSPEARAAVIGLVRSKAAEQQSLGVRAKTLVTGTAKAALGALGGLARTTGIGSVDPETGQRHEALPDWDPVAERKKQQAYEDQEAQADSKPFLTNLREGTSRMWSGMTGLPGAIEDAERLGNAQQFGEEVGEASVRDFAYLMSSPQTALYRDPTRALDLAPMTKAAGAASRAAKFALKGKGFGKTANAAGVAAELMDPGVDSRWSANIKDAPIDTAEAARHRELLGEAVGSGTIDPAEVAVEARKAGSKAPVAAQALDSAASGLELSRPEKVARTIGRAARGAAIVGALGSDAIGPAGALIVGAGAPVVGKAAGLLLRKAAKYDANRRHGISLNDADADAAVARQILDPNTQADDVTEAAARAAAVDAMHESQGVKTGSAPLTEAVKAGEIRAAGIDGATVDYPLNYRHNEWRDGKISADPEAADASRAAHATASIDQREATNADLEFAIAASKRRADLSGAPKETVGESRRLYSAAKRKPGMEAELDRKHDLVLQAAPTPEAVAVADAKRADFRAQAEMAAARSEDNAAREAAKKAKLQPMPRIGSRVDAVGRAEGASARERASLVKFEEAAKAAGPEHEARFNQARDLLHTSIAAGARLSQALAAADEATRKVSKKALARLLQAEEMAHKSVAMERVGQKMRERALAAANAWKKGNPITPDVLVGMHIARRDAEALGRELSSPPELAGLSKTRGEKKSWSLSGAARELAARKKAAEVDAALQNAIVRIDAADEARAAVQPPILADLAETKIASDRELAGIPATARSPAERAVLAERAAKKAEARLAMAIATDPKAVELAGLRREAADLRSAANDLRRGKDGKLKKLDSDDRKYVAARTRALELERELLGLEGMIAEGLTNPLMASSVEAGGASARRAVADAKATTSAAAARKTDKGKPKDRGGEWGEDDVEVAPGADPLTLTGSRTFSAIDPSFDGAALRSLAAGIAQVVGDLSIGKGKVNNILTKAVNTASMLHALNPRIVGWVSKQFRERLRAAGVTDDVVKEMQSYKDSSKRTFDADKTGTFLRRQLEETIVKQIQETDILGGTETVISIALPDGSVFDVGEAVNSAFAALGGEGVSPRELMAQSAKLAFDKLAQAHLEQKTQRVIVDEALRSVDVVADAAGRLPPPVGQAAAFAKTHAAGTPGNIVFFDATPGSADLQQAFGGSPESISADSMAKYGLPLDAAAIDAARQDLVSNFIEAPASLRDAVIGGLAEMGVSLGLDQKVYVRYGYGQSVGAHLDYLKSLGEVGSPIHAFIRSLKRGLTVGSSGATVMNMVSNAVLIGTMTGRPDVIAGFANEARLIREFELNSKAAGVATEEGKVTAALLKTGIGDSSMAREFDTTFASLGSTKGGAQSAWDAYWALRTGIYKQIDAVPKMYLARSQMKQLLADIRDLSPGESMALDQGGGSRALVYSDDAGNLRRSGEILSQEDLYDLAAKQATRSASAALFDFNDTGLLLKSLTKVPGASVFNELGSWFLKAIELPGRQGIVSSAAFFDPSSSYLTNSPKLLARKAKAFAMLGLRRHAMLSSARAVGEYGAPAMSSLLGFEGGSTLSPGLNEDPSSGRDIALSDMTSSNWMMPMLGQAEAVAQLAGGAGDLLSYLSGNSKDVAEAMANRSWRGQEPGQSFRDYRGLSEEARQKAQHTDRMLVRQSEILRGKRDLVSSVLKMMQFTGGLTGRATSATDMDWERKVAPLVMAAFTGADGAALVPFKADKERHRGKTAEWTDGDEDYFRYAMSSLFRLIGREKNSTSLIETAKRREKAALRKGVADAFEGMHPLDAKARVKLFELLIDDEADAAIEEIDRMKGP